MPHGVIMDQFWPADAESFLSSPPPALESLRPVLDQCLLMKGISGVPISPYQRRTSRTGTIDLADGDVAEPRQAE